MSPTPPQLAPSPWPHRLAVLTACATAGLLWVGANVTSLRAGMAELGWPFTSDNSFIFSWLAWLSGPLDLFVEHGHRLFAMGVGLLSIALLISVWRLDDRAWVKRLAFGLFALVCFQGLLGGMRVRLDQRTVALLHGVTGPLVLTLGVLLAGVTSKWWRSRAARVDAGAGRLHRLALATAVVAYAQLVLGALVRHIPDSAPPDQFRMLVTFHLVMAAVVTLHILLVAVRVMRNYAGERLLRRPALTLLALVGAQLLLGLATWVTHYGVPRWIADNAWTSGYTVEQTSLLQVQMTNAHVLTGSLILATAAGAALRSFRLLKAAPRPAQVPGRMLEAAA